MMPSLLFLWSIVAIVWVCVSLSRFDTIAFTTWKVFRVWAISGFMLVMVLVAIVGLS